MASRQSEGYKTAVMDHVFISYARSSEAEAALIAGILDRLDYPVWWDQQLLAHAAYAEIIEERLRAAKAVIVIWTADAVKSQWVRAEANVAREAGTLVQMRVGDVVPPLPFNEIQCVDMTGWQGEADAPGWRKIIASIAILFGKAAPAMPAVAAPAKPPPSAAARSLAAADGQPLLVVLAFDDLSGDPETRYFSDGISEEILHTVSRSKGLRVIAKASSFQFRGADKNVKRIVAELGATHMLDGSVRRAGNQVRINAELVDTASHLTLWSERFDRALSDIFALQDEIAGAIAAALDAHFKPARPATAIDPVAYDLYLQARAIYGQDSTNADRMRCVRLLEQTVALAPSFAMAWGQLALFHGLSLPKTSDEEGAALRPVALSEAQRALALDPECGPAFTALALLKPAFAEYGEKLRLAGRGYALARTEPAVAHLYAGLLMAVGRNREACEVFDAVVECDPSSPYSLAVRAYFYNAAGETVRSIKMAKDLVAQFPASDYARYMLDRIVRSSAADLVVDESEAAAARARLDKRFAELYPVIDLAVVGKAARLGYVDIAFEKLFGAIGEKRPIAFDVSPDGRGFARANVAVGLFVHPMRAVRRDPRFARVCVEVGIYDYWQESGCQPDCVSEVAADYDFMAACAKAAADAGRRPIAFVQA